MGSRIPVIASAEDVAHAAELAERDESIRWYVVKKAISLQATGYLPEAWGEPLVAAYGGEWNKNAREKATSKGQAYGEGSFPIKDKADLKRAIQAFGRAKDKAKAKSHIIKRARALGAVSMLPESWNVGQTASAGVEEFTDVDDLRKLMLREQMGSIE